MSKCYRTTARVDAARRARQHIHQSREVKLPVDTRTPARYTLSPSGMIRDEQALDNVLDLIKQMEATLLEMQQLRRYTRGIGRAMLEVIIDEAEHKLAEVKQRIVH